MAIYCLNCTAREERAVIGQLRTVATKQGWTVIKAFVDRPGAGRTQWAALSRALAAREADRPFWALTPGRSFAPA